MKKPEIFYMMPLIYLGGQDLDITFPAACSPEPPIFALSVRMKKAQNDLNEVIEISSRIGMKQFETDAHLEYAHLLRVSNRTTACDHLNHAAVLIKETGYHRRNSELANIRATLEPRRQ